MKNLSVSHGSITHSFDSRLDCLDCIKVEIEFLQAIQKAGGRTLFIKSLEQEKAIYEESRKPTKSFFDYSTKEKKEIMNKAVEEGAKEQRKLIKKYEAIRSK